MEIFECSAEYFDPKATLESGQMFRYYPSEKGWLVLSADKACTLRQERDTILCGSEDAAYFQEYFDCGRDYSAIVARAQNCGFSCVRAAAQRGKGIRILRQEPEEAILSFLLSQNNNIPRIRSLIERLCFALGEVKKLDGQEYRTFPSAKVLAGQDAAFYRKLGFGYRADYFVHTSRRLAEEGTQKLKDLPTEKLHEQLMTFEGIGPKVADCALLFGFHRTDAFPVDTWVEKVYRTHFGGTLKDRKKIAQYFCSLFQEDGGFIQQYLFYVAREEGVHGKNNDR